MTHTTHDRRVRVGIFATIASASQAIDGLLAAGIPKNEISVICSDQTREAFFKEFPNPPLPTDHLPAAVATGGSVGAVIGGLVGLGALTATGIGVAVAGPLLVALGGGAMAGSLIGAMSTRGFTKEMADFYDQAVTRGKILVAVEDDRDNTPKLTTVELVFAKAGAEPLPLTKT
jgi:hypothetical protein